MTTYNQGLDSQNHVAIIFGATDNGYFMARALKRRGIDVCVFSDTVKNAFRSVMFELCPAPSDPDSLVDFLNKNTLLDNASGLVLIPSTDEFSKFISVYKDRLDEKYKSLLPSSSIVTSCVDKVCFSMLCKDIGVAAPVSFSFSSLNEFEKQTLSFPVIVKPTYARELPKSIVPKVLLLETEEEFLSVAHKVWDFGANVFCQEYIPGGYDCVYFAGAFIDEDHKVDKIFIGRKNMEYPLLGGTTTFCELEWVDDVYDMVCSFVKDTEYCGLIDIEFKRDPRDGQLKIIEVNPRIGQWHRISDDGVMDIVSYYFVYLAGYKSVDGLDRYRPHYNGRKWVYSHYHLIARIESSGLLRGGGRWLADLWGSRQQNDWDILNCARFFRLCRVVLGRMRQLGWKKLFFM